MHNFQRLRKSGELKSVTFAAAGPECMLVLGSQKQTIYNKNSL